MFKQLPKGYSTFSSSFHSGLDAGAYNAGVLLTTINEAIHVVPLAQFINVINEVASDKLQPYFVNMVSILMGWCTEGHLTSKQR